MLVWELIVSFLIEFYYGNKNLYVYIKQIMPYWNENDGRLYISPLFYRYNIHF